MSLEICQISINKECGCNPPRISTEYMFVYKFITRTCYYCYLLYYFRKPYADSWSLLVLKPAVKMYNKTFLAALSTGYILTWLLFHVLQSLQMSTASDAPLTGYVSVAFLVINVSIHMVSIMYSVLTHSLLWVFVYCIIEHCTLVIKNFLLSTLVIKRIVKYTRA